MKPTILSSLMLLSILAAAAQEDEQQPRLLEVRDMDETSFTSLFPLQTPDYIGFTCVIAGLLLAAGGGIGGGGILVPIYILLLEFPVKRKSRTILSTALTSFADAIPLASVTVLGGALANNALNHSKHHPRHANRPCIDWDLMLQLEPMTIAGTLVGAAVNDVLPDILLVVFLLLLLSVTAYKTLQKANAMYQKENEVALRDEEAASLLKTNQQSDDAADSNAKETQRAVRRAQVQLTLLFLVVTLLNLLKGGDEAGGGPLGLPSCGMECFWFTNIAMLLLIAAFAVYIRYDILHRTRPILSDIEWDETNTRTYPLLAIVAGLAAGMFGIGGGIIKGPLMLALGVHASVASATSACMIFFTSITATVSYMAYGMMNYTYAAACLVMGFVATLAGQTIMSALLAHYKRHSFIAYSIALVVFVSAVAMGIESILSIL